MIVLLLDISVLGKDDYILFQSFVIIRCIAVHSLYNFNNFTNCSRNYDSTKAIQMLHATVKWRKDFGVDNIDSWRETIALENSTGKTYVRGFDKQGHVVVYMRPANENTFNHDGNMKHLVYSMERAVACMATTGQEKMSLIIDYTRYSLTYAPPMKTAKETLSILQDHYPERLYRAYCVYPPFIFWAFYNMISPFIDPITKEKIVMLTNSEMSKDSNQLFRDIDRAVLETAVGGEDSRPFETTSYLSSPFNQDYLATLNAQVVAKDDEGKVQDQQS
jgi:hypothetical protein